MLEIGCGQGVATRLVLERLTTGHILALDRSGKMIAAVEASAAQDLAAGRLKLRAEPIETARFDKTFDRVFAVNVDFNLRLGDGWPALLRAALKPDGLLVLAFEAPPGSDKAQGFAALSRARLETGGFTATVRDAGAGIMVITARMAGTLPRLFLTLPRFPLMQPPFIRLRP